MAVYKTPSTQSIFSPAVLLPGVVGSSSVLPPLQASLPWMLLWYLLALSSRSFAALSADDTLLTNTLAGAVDRADDIPALWQVIVGLSFNLDHLHI